MEITMLSAYIISILGLICGLIVSYIAKEELKDGGKYFLILHNILASSILALILISLYLKIWFSVIIALIFLTTLFLIKDSRKIYISYIILAILMFFTENNPRYFFITASLFFIYGFPTASLLLLDRNKK